MKKLMRFLKDEEGGNAAEYALIITLVAVALIREVLAINHG